MPAPLRPHFVNNVLAVAASYVDEDPALARDVLADLGAYLAYRLREDHGPVALRDELDAVATYLRLERSRHPERLELAGDEARAPDAIVAPLAVLDAVEEVVGRRLQDGTGPLRVAVRPAADGGEVRVDVSEPPAGVDPERVVVQTEGA